MFYVVILDNQWKDCTISYWSNTVACSKRINYTLFVFFNDRPRIRHASCADYFHKIREGGRKQREGIATKGIARGVLVSIPHIYPAFRNRRLIFLSIRYQRCGQRRLHALDFHSRESQRVRGGNTRSVDGEEKNLVSGSVFLAAPPRDQYPARANHTRSRGFNCARVSLF